MESARGGPACWHIHEILALRRQRQERSDWGQPELYNKIKARMYQEQDAVSKTKGREEIIEHTHTEVEISVGGVLV
jgi:hypothetical protein